MHPDLPYLFGKNITHLQAYNLMYIPQIIYDMRINTYLVDNNQQYVDWMKERFHGA